MKTVQLIDFKECNIDIFFRLFYKLLARNFYHDIIFFLKHKINYDTQIELMAKEKKNNGSYP